MSDTNDQELERLLKAARDLLLKSRSYGPTTDEERQAKSLINKAKKFAMATRNANLRMEWMDLNYQLKGVKVRKPVPNLNRGFQGVHDPRSYGSGGLADSHEPEGDDIQEAADAFLLRRMEKAEDMACMHFSDESCILAVKIGDLLRAGKKQEGLKLLQDPKNRGLLPIIPREVRSWFGMTVSNSYEPSGDTVSEGDDIQELLWGMPPLGTITLKFHIGDRSKVTNLRRLVGKFGATVSMKPSKRGGSLYGEGEVLWVPKRGAPSDEVTLKALRKSLIVAIRDAGGTYEDRQGLWTKGIQVDEDMDIQEDEWGGGFQSPADAHREVQAGLKADYNRERSQKLKWIVQVIRGEISKQKFKKLAGISFDEIMTTKYRNNWYVNQVKRMSKKALAPVKPVASATTEETNMDIQEKVDIDGRTRAYRETVMRLEAARKLREQRMKAMQENRFGGLYDDGSGKGAVVPAPVDFNFHEAMRVVEKYRSLREKKKTLMGAPKEDMDAAIVMKGDKFSMSETELSPKQKEFRTFFKKALTKFGKSSPAKMDDAEKKKFFNWIEKNWKG